MSLRKDLLEDFGKLTSAKQKKAVSIYDPKGSERERLISISRDYDRADLVRSGEYEEFNHSDLMNVVDRDRKAFNNYITPDSDDPDESWKANTIRPITRNKVISIAAHISSALLFPQIFAQNDNDEEDRNAALVMRDLNLWANEQSDYALKFVKGIVKALVDPAMIMYEGYAEVMRKIKELKSDGSWTEKEILDELYSGFQNLLVPVEEFYISNIYESSLQKQPFIIWRKVIPFEEAQLKYGQSENFKTYVRPGIKVFYSDDLSGFYEMYDQSLSNNLVEEIVYFNRFSDLELRVVNGILLDDPDRPIQRQDKMYPFAHTGFEFFGGTDFFYFKSLVDKMSSDQEVIDTLYNMVIDGTFLRVMPPAVISGDDTIDGAVIIPGAITTISENSKFETINTNNNLTDGLNMLQKVESSLSESSTDPITMGHATEGTPATAYQVSRQEANAKTVMGLFGRMISQWVEDFGKLRINSILQNMTVAQVAEITGSSTRLKYRQFLLPPKEGEPGKTKKIEFDMNFPEDEEGRMKKSFELLERETKTKSKIALVSPELFRRNKYLLKVKADFMPMQSESVKKALNLEAYDRAIANPLLDQEKVTSEFLIESYRPGQFDDFKKRNVPKQTMNIPGGNSNMASQILNKAEAKAVL